MNLVDTLTTSPHYLHKKRIETTKERLNIYILGFKRLTVNRGLLILVEKGRRGTLGTKLSQRRIKVMAGEGRGEGRGVTA